MSNIHPFSKNDGFTLLEILIAVAILATSFVILLSASGNSYLISARAERLTKAVTLSREKMTELEIGFMKDSAKNKFPDEDQAEDGTFDEPFDDYRWSYTIKKVEIPIASSGDGGGNEESEESGESGQLDLAVIQDQMKVVTDEISKLTREVQLTIYWGDKNVPLEKQPRMTVTTHWVNLQ